MPISDSNAFEFPSHSIESVPVVIPATASSEVNFRRGDNRQNRRVLHVVNGEFYSGAERVQDLLAESLPQFGYDVGFAVVKPGLFSDLRQFKDAPIYDASMRSRFDVRVVSRLGDIIRREGYDLIHAHTPRSAMIGRILSTRTGRPMVYHVHSPTVRDSTNKWRNRVNGFIERLSLSGAARLITVSESLSGHMRREGYDAGQVSVVPNGVKCLESVPYHNEPKGEWTLGTVALFRPRKGTEYLLDAIAILNQRGIPVRLRAIGGFETTEYEQRLKRLANKLGIEDQIEWVGFCKDVDAEMSKMDLFVLPSIFGEGLPMVVLEAMACGIPVIGTDVEGVPEAIRDGIEGLIAKASDAGSLADSIAAVVEGEFSWLELRQHCIDRQAELFSDRSMARGVADVYDSVLGTAAVESLSPSSTTSNENASEEVVAEVGSGTSS